MNMHINSLILFRFIYIWYAVPNKQNLAHVETPIPTESIQIGYKLGSVIKKVHASLEFSLLIIPPIFVYMHVYIRLYVHWCAWREGLANKQHMGQIKSTNILAYNKLILKFGQKLVWI